VLTRFAFACCVLLLAGAALAQSASPYTPAVATDAVIDLSFDQIYRRPVGPYGLELSKKVVALNGKRVRISGFMVAEEAPVAGRFLLAPLPVALSDVEDGPADDLPPAVVYVRLAGADANARVRYQREPLQLTGVLHVGNTVEPDDRVSLFRLTLDPPPATERR
jgi:hypothetical protein